MTETATVETLTAEVRVLMVGNRQVTLSVARQLDKVTLEEMEPFGRVRIDKDRQPSVIGRHIESGSLAVADYRTHRGMTIIDGSEFGDEEAYVTVCDQYKFNRHEAAFVVELNGRTIHLFEDAVQRCGKHPYGKPERCGGWNPNGLEGNIRAAIEEQDLAFKPHKLAADLPLIVLAGLR